MTNQHWSDTPIGREIIRIHFEAAKMPEISEDQLETGTYTNQQIVEKCKSSFDFIHIMRSLPTHDDAPSKRSILSIAVDMMST